MTMPARPRRGARGDALGLRLALAFLAVALAAVALLAGLTAAFAAADVSALASAAAHRADKCDRGRRRGGLGPEQQLGLRRPVAGPGPGRSASARPSRSATGRVMPSHPRPVSPRSRARRPAPQWSSAGSGSGRPSARFTGSGLSAADRRLQAALLRAIAGAAGLAALLALVTGLVAARRITRPVAKLIAVTRAMTAGDRSARAGPVQRPAELRELAAAFDQMADTLDRQEQIRRNLVAAVAHELRTPIAVLQAGHEALLDGVTEPTRGRAGLAARRGAAAGADGRRPAGPGRR